MCLIAVLTPGTPAFSDEDFARAWQANDDGAGYMFCANGVLVVRKPFYKLKHLRRAFTADHAKYGAESHFVLHFRWATHGNLTADNVHPHALNSRTALVHNGVLDIEPPWKSDMSDTAFFCATVLARRSARQLTDKKFGLWLGKLIGPSNKFAILSADNVLSIVNEASGVWEGGVWLSNTYWRAVAACGYVPAHRRCAVDGTDMRIDPWGDVPDAKDDKAFAAWVNGRQGQIDEADLYALSEIDWEERRLQDLEEQKEIDASYERAVRK